MNDRVWFIPDLNQAESRIVAWKGPVPKLKQWYQEGVDVHARVCNMIADVIQKTGVQMPINPDTNKMLFYSKNVGEYAKGDEEREIAKRGVHAGNYEEGDERFAVRTGLPLEQARVFKKVYNTLLPEIKGNYHRWIQDQLKQNRTIWTPEPVRFRKVFFDKIDDDLYRKAYAYYPQSTVGSILNQALVKCCNIFLWDDNEELKDQWCAWYDSSNWDTWRRLRESGVRTPQAILWSGMDVRLQVHDGCCVSIPNDPDLLRWAALRWREAAEVPIQIQDNETMVIPMDFKVGKTWGSEDLKDYKI